ncbi:MAG: DUF1592 domain-containing protein, partial [Planctomycetes bacterium]|nr:DUF1592 domain-containing protein [Planctomycetota bacterium]
MFLTALGSALPAVQADFETPIALTNAKIVTASGEVIENGTIVIENQRIKAVGADVDIPPHAEILDATDLIIYPGFIDANTHMGITRNEPSAEERARVEDEWADVSQGPHSSTAQAFRRLMHPSWRAEDLFDPQSAKMDDFRKAGFTVALVSPKQAIFSGRSAVILMGEERLRRSVLKTDFAQHGALSRGSRGRFTRPGPGGGGSSGPRYPTTTMGAMAAFRQILIDARWHREQQAWWLRHAEEERPPLDEDLEALWPVLDAKLPVVFIANSENEIHRALDMAAEFGLKPIIAGAREGWRVADRLKKENVPVILSLNWPEDPVKNFRDKGRSKKDKRPGRGSRQGRRGADVEGDADEEADTEEPDEEGKQEEDQPDEKKEKKPDPRAKLKPIFDDEWEKKAFEPEKVVKERDRLWGEQVDNAKVLHEKGVNFVIGSFEMRSADSVLKKLRMAIERGLPENVAVAALTSNAAELLGVDDLIGDIVPGKLANLTVLTKPLGDEKSNRFVRDFLGQWLRLYKVNATTPDAKLYPEYDELLGHAIPKEPELFFAELIKENLSLTNLIDSDFIFVNRRLATHYGIPDVAGQQFRRIDLPDDSPRGGVLTQAAILKTTANGTVTSPVTRGNFVLTNLLGTPPDPPPANVGSIEPDTRGKTT